LRERSRLFDDGGAASARHFRMKGKRDIPTRSEIVTGSLATLVGKGCSSGSGEVVGVVVFPSFPSVEVGDSGKNGEPSEEDAGKGAARGGEAGGGATGGGTSSFFFGRKAALMSPIPTKNSSARRKVSLGRSRRHGEEGKESCGRREGERTGNNLDEVRTPIPHISTIVDDYDHVGVAGEESL
jgi:hypothetical protein